MKIFDSHLHIIDYRFPIDRNGEFAPAEFRCSDYLRHLNNCKTIYGETMDFTGGAIVSGSFQRFDQTYLSDALKRCGSAFVGVTQLPKTVSDDEIIRLNEMGVRGIRFNLRRGGSESIDNLESMAKRVYELAGWHTELYIDSKRLNEIHDVLILLPAVSIDHIGLSKDGFKNLLKLAQRGIYVKASGFGRVDFDVSYAISELNKANPNCLMFGTDLPSTRAPRKFDCEDIKLILDTLSAEESARVLYGNAVKFYGVPENK